MIDWWELLFNALWVFGCAFQLAILSYTNWQASTQRIRWRACLAQPRYQQALLWGCVLISLGFAGVVDGTWRRIVLLGLALAGIFLIGQHRSRSKLEQ